MGEWWLDLDRKQELSALHSLMDSGGCLVLAGDDTAGRSNAARLMMGRLEEAGFETFAVNRVTRSNTVRSILRGAWALMGDDVPVEVVPPWNIPGGTLPVHELVQRVAACMRDSTRPRALVVETPDRHQRLQAHDASVFREIGLAAGRPVVVTSVASSNTRWPRGADSIVRLLGAFTRADVLDLLMSTPQVRGRGLTELAEIVDLVTDGAETVEPDQAYARLVAWSKA